MSQSSKIVNFKVLYLAQKFLTSFEIIITFEIHLFQQSLKIPITEQFFKELLSPTPKKIK